MSLKCLKCIFKMLFETIHVYCVSLDDMTYNGLFVRLSIPVTLTDEVQMFKGNFLEEVILI